MYDIIDLYNNKYTVNSEHLLCLKDAFNKDVIMEVNHFINLPPRYQCSYKCYRTAVDFKTQVINSNAYTIGYETIDNIDKIYLINSKNIRNSLFAGIIDKYGLITNEGVSVPLNINFKDDLIFLGRSIGFLVYVKNNLINIIGNFKNIPTQIINAQSNIKNILSYNFNIIFNKKDKYYGFTLDGNHKYILGDFTVTHNTCTAAGVMDAFWDTDRPIIFASSIDAIASNPDYKFHECAMNLFPRFNRGIFKGRNNAESMALIASAFKKRNIKFLSFAKLSNRVVKAIAYKKEHKGGARIIKDKTDKEILESEGYVDLSNAVLIIDEVHNLFRPLANQQKEHALLEAEILDPNKHPNLKVIILTATPGDNIPDIIKLLNIIRNPKEPVIKAPNIEKTDELKVFKKQIRGLISFFDMSNDITKFPTVKDDLEFIKTPMSQIQFEKYIEAYSKVTALQKNYAALSKANQISKYWEPARKYANMLFNFDKDMDLSDFSSKIPYLLDNISKYPSEKQYVYSAFYTKMGYGGQGIVAIAKEMEKIGYTKLTISEAKRYNKTGKLPPKGKRYILAISTEIGEEKGDTGKNLNELIKIYNHYENRHGELIHVMLASQRYNEGIDLRAVRHIHLFEPLVSMASDIQSLGRARRYCSHSDLPLTEWNVTVHRYMSEKPLPIIIDNGPIKQKLEQEINDLELEMENLDNKEFIKLHIKAIKEKEKVLKATEKMIDKGKASPTNIKTVKNDIKVLNDLLDKYKKQGEDGKEKIINIKLQIKEKQKELKNLDKPPKFLTNDIENIEERIFDESRVRMKELLTVYQCMKEAAVDCKIMNKFHSHIGSKIICQN
jgi:hypothetical protein